MCDKCDGMGGEKRHGLLVMLRWTYHLHSPQATASLVHSPSPTFCCCPGMKEIKQDAAVPRGSCHADHSTVAIMITFHLVRRPPVEDSQPGDTDMDSWLCSLLNARHWVTITYRHTDATDSPMFGLAPILPMSDVWIGLTLLAFFAVTVHGFGTRCQLHYVWSIIMNISSIIIWLRP